MEVQPSESEFNVIKKNNEGKSDLKKDEKEIKKDISPLPSVSTSDLNNINDDDQMKKKRKTGDNLEQILTSEQIVIL